jgi:hypothetical protein
MIHDSKFKIQNLKSDSDYHSHKYQVDDDPGPGPAFEQLQPQRIKMI